MISGMRFDCPSASLVSNVPLKRTRAALWIGLALAIGAHLAATQLGGFSKQQTAAQPLTTQFIKRQPCLTKPLELKKRPKPRRRRLQRKMVAVKAREGAQHLTSRIQALGAIPSMARPNTRVGRSLAEARMDPAPQALAGEVAGSMTAKQVVDMSLEMMDIDALDCGRYHAMVIQDPNDKRDITGYLHLWMPWGLNYANRTEKGHGKWYWHESIKHGVRRVVLKLNEWTDIKADVKGVIGFDSAELLDTPWVVVAHLFKMFPTDGELENLCRYMETGGFVFTQGDPETDNRGLCFVDQEQIRGGCSVVRLALQHGGYPEFKEWVWESLPRSHPIFHCYFDFASGPPAGGLALYRGYGWLKTDPDPPKVDAIEIAGRIAAVTNNALYVECWGRWGPGGFPWSANRQYFGELDPTRQLQFGVNTIIFALTQEGSITHRLMASVR